MSAPAEAASQKTISSSTGLKSNAMPNDSYSVRLAVLELVRAGCGIGFVRRDFVKPEDPDLVCIPLKTPIFSYVTLKWRKEGVLQEVVNQLAAMIPSEEK